MSIDLSPAPELACVNGVALNASGEALTPEVLRQRACTELLRQAAQREGLLDAAEAPSADGVISERAAAAIDALLEKSLAVPEPSEEACRRHYTANVARYRSGERVRVRHILFAVTPGVDVAALRGKAEGALLDVRCNDGGSGEGFARAAAALSNCPSGAEGGALGWLTESECAPEFAREIFGRVEVGVLPRLTHSRYGLHVVEVLEREPGTQRAYEEVRDAVALSLRQSSYVTAVRHYLRVLAGDAKIEGVALEAAATPLVQ